MQSNESFPLLFSPVNIRGHKLKNRIVFGAHTSNMSEKGLPGKRHIYYYRERAIGGAAMIVIEPIPVHQAAVLTRGNFLHSTNDVIPHFRKVTDAVHDEGSIILQQLYHVGQHGDADNSFHPNWSPSGLPPCPCLFLPPKPHLLHYHLGVLSNLRFQIAEEYFLLIYLNWFYF